MAEEKVLENRLRRTLNRRGYVLHKSRRRDAKAFDFGGYMIVDGNSDSVVAGSTPRAFSMSLQDVEAWLKD